MELSGNVIKLEWDEKVASTSQMSVVNILCQCLASGSA